MKASRFEFHYRYLIHVLIFVIGFFSPWWDRYLPVSHGMRTWLLLASWPARAHWLSLYTASVVVTSLAIFFAAAGALLRTWGTAYMSAEVVNDAAMHGGAIVADGPYRHLRNPLYLGTWLHTLAISILMEPLGSIFTVLAIGIFQLRLIGGEESFLREKLGAPYIAYCARVPRLLASPTPRVPAAGRAPQWLKAILGEAYFLSAALSFAIVSWKFNADLLSEFILGSFGVAMIAKAFIPKPTADIQA